MLIKILFITAFFNLCYTEETPSISYITPQQITDIGGSIELNCTVKDNADYYVVWNKINRDRPTDIVNVVAGEQLLIRNSRFQFEKDNETNSYCLKINDIQPLDTGIYECQIILNSNEKIKQQVEVLVRQPPVILDNQTTLETVLQIGDTANLTCAADGYPRPSISWKREYNAILPIGGHLYAGNMLRIPTIQKEDRGIYYCNADNGVGRPDVRSVNVEVQFAPHITIPRPKVAQAINYDIELECVVEAYPTPVVTWRKDDKPIMNNDDYHISQVASVDKKTRSILKIISLEVFQYGDYYCVALNSLGQAEKRLNIFPSDIPDINFRGWIITSSTVSVSTNGQFCVLIGLMFGIITTFDWLI